MDKSILEVVHESAKDMYEIGVMDEKTMREFDELCLPETKKLQLREKLNRPVFTRKPVKNIRVAQR